MALDMIGGGLIYFPLATNFWENEKIKAMENKFEEIGVYRWIKFLGQRVYKSNGYFTKWSDIDAKLYSEANNYNLATLNSLIEFCFEYDLLSRDVYDTHGILTGRGIQEVYLNAIKKNRTRTVTMIWEYCTLEPEDYKDFTNTTIKITNLRKEYLDKSKLPIRKIISRKISAEVNGEPSPERQKEFNDAIDRFCSVNSDIAQEDVKKPESEQITYSFDEAMAFSKLDFEKQNDLLKAQIESQKWLTSYNKVLTWIDSDFKNLKLMDIQLRYAEYRASFKKEKFTEDQLYAALKKLSLSGNFNRYSPFVEKMDQYLFFIRHPDVKNSSTPAPEKKSSIPIITGSPRAAEFKKIQDQQKQNPAA